MTAIICRPNTFPLRRIAYCPTEKRRRRFAGPGQPSWYGVIWTCCGCGDSWGDGERLPRPFMPRWRQAETAKAKRLWQRAGEHTRDEWKAWLRAELGWDDNRAED